MPSASLGSSSAEQALEAEHQRELAPPLDRRLLPAGVELRQRGIERPAARGPLRQRRGGVLAFEHERLARELLRAPKDRRRRPAGSQPRKCFQPMRPLFWWERQSGTGRLRGDKGPARARRGPPSCRRSLRVPSSGVRRGASRAPRPPVLQHTNAGFGHSPRLPSFTAMTARLALLISAAVLVAGCSSDDPESAAPSPKRAGAGAGGAHPRLLAELHVQANELLGGGREAFERRLARLKGYPVVVNKWASWCPPCRAEFPYFQKQSVERGKKIAFLGVDGNDNDARREGVPRRATRCTLPELQGPRPEDRGGDEGGCGVSRRPPSTTRRASWPT